MKDGLRNPALAPTFAKGYGGRAGGRDVIPSYASLLPVRRDPIRMALT